MIYGSVKFSGADLTTCDQEPIHIPGSIQPHSVVNNSYQMKLLVMAWMLLSYARDFEIRVGCNVADDR